MTAFKGFSTGSAELDALLEELRPGDNVVFYTHDPGDYLPFVSVLLGYVRSTSAHLVYARAAGFLDDLVNAIPQAKVLDISGFYSAHEPLKALREAMEDIGPRVYYLFEPLSFLAPWCDEQAMRDFFLTICPLPTSESSHRSRTHENGH